MNRVCGWFGHPERAFRSVHVAGTNGKGSTANYIKNILQCAGYRTGNLYFSLCHTRSTNESESIDEFISDADFLSYANRLKDTWDRLYAETGFHHVF
jgi:dihydrofolate synthase/folylpolyglutamate synthase